MSCSRFVRLEVPQALDVLEHPGMENHQLGRDGLVDIRGQAPGPLDVLGRQPRFGDLEAA
jgi:hypothetical protein